MEAPKLSSKLNPVEFEEVLEWVDSFELSRCRRKLNRDFSDGVLLAEILKNELPSLVDLHNYNGCFAVQGKVRNWEMLNRKVMKKLDIHLKPDEIEQLARADTNIIEDILFQIMKQVKLIKSRSENKSQTNFEHQSSVMTVKVWKQVGDHVEQVPQRMIEYSMYEQLLEKSENQEEKIQELQEAIDDLQCALSSKTQIIDDLQERLEKKKQRKSSRSLSIEAIRDSITNFF